jgi:hypothetical protein
VDQEGDAGSSGKAGVMDSDKPQFFGWGGLVDVGQVVLVCWDVSAVSSRAVKWWGVMGSQSVTGVMSSGRRSCCGWGVWGGWVVHAGYCMCGVVWSGGRASHTSSACD